MSGYAAAPGGALRTRLRAGWRSGGGLESDLVAEGREPAAVNGGLHTAVRPLVMELTPLRVNAVAAGVIDTPLEGGMPGPVRDNVFASAARRKDSPRTHPVVPEFAR